MTNYDDVAQRWHDVSLGKATRLLKHGNMPCEKDHIYSYGSHFELAQLLRTDKGEPTAWLLNGDTYSVTTSRHQSVIRGVLSSSHLPRVIIPHEALRSAGVFPSTVQIIDVSADRNETTHHRTHEQPEGSVWQVQEEWTTRELTRAEKDAFIDVQHSKNVEDWGQRVGWATDGTSGYWSEWLTRHPEAPARPGDEVISGWERSVSEVTGHHDVLHTSSSIYSPEITVTVNDDGSMLYEWETSRHWLGESLIRAATSTNHWRACKTCGGSGLRPGVLIRNEEAAHWRPRSHWCETCYGGRGETYIRRRWAYYLSGFDHQERRPLYFFCELPKGKPTTIAEAYELLKPTTVQLAEQMNRPITRQGDIFAVQAPSLDKRSLRKAGATFTKRGVLLGTNHVATEVAYLPTGQTLARGILHHDPQWRRPDHARRRLADGWHIVLKNTVPLTIGRG